VEDLPEEGCGIGGRFQLGVGLNGLLGFAEELEAVAREPGQDGFGGSPIGAGGEADGEVGAAVDSRRW
jgi:hypothetical protein